MGGGGGGGQYPHKTTSHPSSIVITNILTNSNTFNPVIQSTLSIETIIVLARGGHSVNSFHL